MAKEYSHTQYPKFKDFQPEELSNDQILIRTNKKKYVYGNTINCRTCGNDLPIAEYYIKDRHTGRRSTQCRDCELRADGIVEIGKTRFAMIIFKKNFRRCAVCKDTLPLTEFSHDKNRYGGYSNNCKGCNAAGVAALQQKGKTEITDWYVKEYGKRFGITNFDEETIAKLRQEIIEKREPKYFLDGKEFLTAVDLAKYIESKYGLPLTMTKKRIADGKTPEECKISEHDARSAAYTKGKVKVTDMVTGKVYEFKNTRDPDLLKMFSVLSITNGLKGRIIGERQTKANKYPNPCTIERVETNNQTI